MPPPFPSLNRAVESHPKDARAWKALGVAYAAQGMFELAEHPFGQACKLDPKLDDACYFYGRALYTLNRFQPSLEVLESALRNNGKDWKVRLGVAQALEALGEAGRAEAEFRRDSRRLSRSRPAPRHRVRSFPRSTGPVCGGVVPVQEVLSRFPESSDAHIHIGRALNELGRNQDASVHSRRPSGWIRPLRRRTCCSGRRTCAPDVRRKPLRISKQRRATRPAHAP